MATLKSFLVLTMLAFQLLCLGYLVHGSTTTIVPHEFIVCLNRNYTLKSHFEYIGKELNISHYLEIIDCYEIDFHNTTRTHDLSEESILDLIRSDPNVYSVAPEFAFSFDCMEGTCSPSPKPQSASSKAVLEL
ncbi:hypothetical protein KCU95_g13169, partial [Aureobasidium melanogenum]